MRRSRSGRRGVALADFLAGTMILSGALSALFAMTRAKFMAIKDGEQRAVALASAEAAVDSARTLGLPGRPGGEADPDGYRLVSTFPVDAVLRAGEGRVEARALRCQGGDARGLLEVRVVVAWQADASTTGRSRLALSTVAAEAR